MINKGDTFPTPTISEAATIADILDGLGAYDEAELLDEYIERSAQVSGDMIKMAGFWSDIWKRMKGRTKRLFIKEFREAHDAAKQVQEDLAKRVDVVNEKFGRIAKALKTYQLADWYKELADFSEIGGNEMLASSGFQDTYGRFMQAILGAKEVSEKREEKEKPEVEKVFGPSDEKKDVGEGVAEIGEWSPVVRRQPAVEEHFEGEKIRVQLPWWNKWAKKHLRRIPDEQGRIIFKVMPTVRDEKGEVTQQTPVNLEKSMGEDFWEVERHDDEYVYLNKAKVEKKIEPPEAVPPDEEAFEKEPELPKPELKEEAPKEPGKTPSVEAPEGEITFEEEEPEEVKEPEEKPEEPSEVEKEMEEEEGKEAEELGLKALEGTTWIRYNENARKDLRGMYRPVRKVRPKVHDIETDEEKIKILNRKWVESHSPTQKGVSLDSDDKSGIRLASRQQRILRIMELSE